MTEPATDDAEPGTVGSAAWWRLWQLRQARRRPRADGLTVERIIAVALAIVDAEGLDALTVRRIADQLGTGSATLYRHYTSREELLELLVDHVIGEVRLPPPELGWRSKVYGAANRDPRVFDDPDTFDVRRDPNPHVGFGGPGPHFCLGAHLARRELSIIFRQLFARLPDIEVVGEPVHLAAMGIPLVGGIKHLPVRFTPTAPVRSR